VCPAASTRPPWALPDSARPIAASSGQCSWQADWDTPSTCSACRYAASGTPGTPLGPGGTAAGVAGVPAGGSAGGVPAAGVPAGGVAGVPAGGVAGVPAGGGGRRAGGRVGDGQLTGGRAAGGRLAGQRCRDGGQRDGPWQRHRGRVSGRPGRARRSSRARRPGGARRSVGGLGDRAGRRGVVPAHHQGHRAHGNGRDQQQPGHRSHPTTPERHGNTLPERGCGVTQTPLVSRHDRPSGPAPCAR